jgi:hypothetical protein
MAKGLRKRYAGEMKKHFPKTGILFPITQWVKLGDYGIYVKDSFWPKGNIFEDFGMELSKFISQRLEDSAEANFLLISDNVKNIKSKVEDSGNNIFKISQTIEFHSRKGFVIHLFKLKTDNIYLKRTLEQKIIELAKQKIWIDEYRLVVQRSVTHAMKFAYSIQKDGKITFLGQSDHKNTPIKDLELTIDYQNTTNMKTDFWVDEGENFITPLVRFAKLSEHGLEPAFRSLRGDQKVQILEEPRLIMDNSESFLEIEEFEDEMNDET